MNGWWTTHAAWAALGAAVGGGIVAGFACSRRDESASLTTTTNATTPGNGAASDDETRAQGGPTEGEALVAEAEEEANGPTDIAWDVPKGWKVKPNTSPMRKATYGVPHVAPDTEDAEVSVTQVGGTIDANIERWGGQFGGATPKRTEKKVAGLDVTLVELHGTFAGAMGPMGGASPEPKKGAALLGAIVHTAPPYFFKMVGPAKTVTAAKGDLDALVASVRAK